MNEDWQKWLNALMGIKTPDYPIYSEYDPTGPGGIPVSLGGSGPSPSSQGHSQYYSAEAQENYAKDVAGYEAGMKQIEDDAKEHLLKWMDKFPAAGTAGQAMKAPEAISMGPLAPANEMALYGRPQAFPGITSITNLKRRTA